MIEDDWWETVLANNPVGTGGGITSPSRAEDNFWRKYETASKKKISGTKKITREYRGVVFDVEVSEAEQMFLSDDGTLEKEDVELLRVVYPETYKKVESAWIAAYQTTSPNCL